MKTITTFMFATVTVGALCCSCESSKGDIDNSTVASFTLKQYLGDWYEIARFDHSFEKNLSNCTARYTMRKDGTVLVFNRGFNDRKFEWEDSEGKAKTTDTSGLLRVSFFGPFYSDYRVMMLAPDYSYALIGSDDSDYLWILARTPEIPQNTHEKLVEEAEKRGYDTSKLIWVDQSRNI